MAAAWPGPVAAPGPIAFKGREEARALLRAAPPPPPEVRGRGPALGPPRRGVSARSRFPGAAAQSVTCARREHEEPPPRPAP